MPDKDKDKEAKLNLEIKSLKKKLEQVFQKRKSLHHPEVLNISLMLDEKIMEYTRYMKMKNKESEIPEEFKGKKLE